MSNVVAILCSDLHLSEKPPLARSSEPDWFAAMARVLGELRGLQEQHDCPILFAGDLFDKWRAPPSIINFAIKHLPKMYTIPGQHDLPHHRLEDIERSAYWTLVEAGTIEHVEKPRFMNQHLCIYPFPWGEEIEPASRTTLSKTLHVALVHQYVGMPANMYPGAPPESNVNSPILQEKLEGYDVAVFGDNHKGFTSHTGDCNVYNCGTPMRRKADEINYRSGVGLLQDDGTIITHYLDTSKDVIEAVEKPADDELDISEFVEELHGLGGDFLEFEDAIERYVEKNGVKQCVREVIQRVMEEK